MRLLEAQMIDPVRQLMLEQMQLDVIVQEFSAGYGFADLVGGKLCNESCQSRAAMGLDLALDHRHLVHVLLSLSQENKLSMGALLNQVTISESTLRNKVFPHMKRLGLIERDTDGDIKLITAPPKPTQGVIAVEAKQTRWREAILQARRYTFFADQTYIAVWSKTVNRIDRELLKIHNIGLISVETESAEILIEAPRMTPREAVMNRFCAEFLYGYALNSGSTIGNSHVGIVSRT